MLFTAQSSLRPHLASSCFLVLVSFIFPNSILLLLCCIPELEQGFHFTYELRLGDVRVQSHVVSPVEKKRPLLWSGLSLEINQMGFPRSV